MSSAAMRNNVPCISKEVFQEMKHPVSPHKTRCFGGWQVPMLDLWNLFPLLCIALLHVVLPGIASKKSGDRS